MNAKKNLVLTAVVALVIAGCQFPTDNHLAAPAGPVLSQDESILAGNYEEYAGTKCIDHKDLAKAWRGALPLAGVTGGSPLVRTPLYDDLVEYSAVIPVGPGEFDRIGIHRVVRESSPWHPVSAPRGIMLLHGSPANFRNNFVPGLVDPAIAPLQNGFAPFLAEAGIDVWGVDLRWSLVPAGQTDFSFMKSWNFETDIRDIRVVTVIARLCRGWTGSGAGPLFFSGHSLGAALTYAYANADSRRPRKLRDVRGLIPLEYSYKLVSEESQFLRDAAAQRYRSWKEQYDSGVYSLPLTDQLKPVIDLALTAPDDPSALIPGFTNLQTATAIYSCTYIIYAPLPAYTPFYHFVAGTFDPATGLPTGFQFADREPIFTFTRYFPPYQPLAEGMDLDGLASGIVDLPYDDHLSDVTAPVFYVGAAGGFGDFGTETLSLLGSADKSSLIVRLLPAGNELVDYGHIDIMYASNARTLVWDPVRAWILAH